MTQSEAGRAEIARAALAAAERAVRVGDLTAAGSAGERGRGLGAGSGDGFGDSPADTAAARRAARGHSTEGGSGRDTGTRSRRGAGRRRRRGAPPVGDAPPAEDDAPPPEDEAIADPEPDAHDVARQIVLRQLTMAPRSRAELEKKLAERNCAPEVAAVVLDRMEEVGLVDDEAYAGMLVRSQRAGRGLARRGLRSELRRKGVADDVIDDAVGAVSDDDERADARRLVDKRLRTMHGLPAQTQARRLAAMLARKGYGSETAYTVVREALREAPEHRRD